MNAQTKVKAASLIEALPLALAAVENAKKDANNPHFKSKYSTLASVIDAIRPVAAHGIWFRQVPLACERGVAYETFYIGYGDQISAGISEVPVSKNDAQGVGSAKTYARRYGLMDAFGIAPEDDDGNAAAKAPPRQQPKFISDEQWAEVTALMQATNTDAGKFCKAFGIESVKALTLEAYPKAKAQLERKLTQSAETVDA